MPKGGLDIRCPLVFAHVLPVLETALICPLCVVVLSLLFAGVAVQANAVQQCLTPLERSPIRASQILVSLLDPLLGNAQFTGDVCNRLSTVLGELHHLALTFLRSDLLDFCMYFHLSLPESILNF